MEGKTQITARELNRNTADVINRTRYAKENFVVMKHGKPVAEINPVKTENGNGNGKK